MTAYKFKHKITVSPKVTSFWSKVKTRSNLSTIILTFLILIPFITSMALSKEDFLAFMSQNQIEREKEIQNLTAMVKEGVRDEVRLAVTTIVAKQNLLEDKQICLENDHSSLKSRVCFLESELASIKNNPPSVNFPALPTVSTISISAEPTPDTVSSDDTPDALRVLQEAKKVLGFSPIPNDHIDYLKEQYSIVDDFEAKKTAIQEFLEFEMKIPRSSIEKFSMRRIFPPAKQVNSKTLYVEFSDVSTTEHIQQFVTHLNPGVQLSIYIPHALYPRYRAVRDIANSLRFPTDGSEKLKYKIKWGLSDFVLLTKSKQGSWTHASLSSLPPLKLFPIGNSASSSPAPGRQRLLSKRTRSPEDNSPNARTSKIRKEVPNLEIESKDDDTKTPENLTPPSRSSIESKVDQVSDDPPKTPQKSSLSSAKDQGSFLPSACISPNAAANKNFTFGNSLSSIPTIQKSLNC